MNRFLAPICLTIAVLLGSAGVSESADYLKGYTAYQSGDYATALREWTPLAKQGNANAQTNLGWMYNNGKGVPQDYKTAVKWYRLAAEQGVAVAQYNLGFMYDQGLGVPQDYKTAVKWYRLAAEQGDADAQKNLGVMYADGRGVPQDDKTAVKWYKLSAEQGNARAQSNLKKLKTRLVSKGIDDCLFDEIAKITGPETKRIVEKHCRRKLEKKSLGWLIRNSN
jgi:TPR repeat protein